uniref:Uncharacterized protein n=1 Tax=Anguilla anguilla TaxID=7936 RepID=A0A0E9XT24_ANGAN
MFPKGLLHGDVWVQKLQRVFGQDTIVDQLVFANDVGERQSAEALFCIRDNRTELYVSVIALVHPGEGDPSQMTLAETQQKSPHLPVLQQNPLSLLSHKSHDAPIHPEILQVFLDEFQDGVQPRPKSERPPRKVLLTEHSPRNLTVIVGGLWTQKFISQHAQLFPVEPKPDKGGELPVENLRQLSPGAT